MGADGGQVREPVRAEVRREPLDARVEPGDLREEPGDLREEPVDAGGVPRLPSSRAAGPPDG